MISRDVEITDLDPRLWKNFSFFWKKPNFSDLLYDYPNTLSILHDQGHVLRMYAPKDHGIPEIQQVDDTQDLAKKLYYQYPGLDCVQILEKHCVQIYSAKVQKLEWQSLDYDDFLLLAYQLAEEDPSGLCFFPPRSATWQGFSIPTLRDWLSHLPNPSSIVIGIYKDSAPWFTLILRLSDKKIKLITTFEYFSRFGVDVKQLPSSINDLGPINDLASQHIAPVSTAFVCDFSVAEHMMRTAQKGDVLAQAIATGNAAMAGIPFQ